MAGLLQFTQWQMNALLELEDAFSACERQGLSFAGFKDTSLQGLIDMRAFNGPHIGHAMRDGYWVKSQIDDRR